MNSFQFWVTYPSYIIIMMSLTLKFVQKYRMSQPSVKYSPAGSVSMSESNCSCCTRWLQTAAALSHHHFLSDNVQQCCSLQTFTLPPLPIYFVLFMIFVLIFVHFNSFPCAHKWALGLLGVCRQTVDKEKTLITLTNAEIASWHLEGKVGRWRSRYVILLNHFSIVMTLCTRQSVAFEP